MPASGAAAATRSFCSGVSQVDSGRARSTPAAIALVRSGDPSGVSFQKTALRSNAASMRGEDQGSVTEPPSPNR
jgi:hypothetical protein